MGSNGVGVVEGSGVLSVSLFSFFWLGCVFLVSLMGFFPCWCFWAGDAVGSGVWVPAGLGSERDPASWSCCPFGVHWVLSVFLLGAVFLSSSFSWGCVVPVSRVGSFPCWRTCAAGETLASWGLLPGSLASCLSVGLSFRGCPSYPWMLGGSCCPRVAFLGGPTVLLEVFFPMESWESLLSWSFLDLVGRAFRCLASCRFPVPSFLAGMLLRLWFACRCLSWRILLISSLP